MDETGQVPRRMMRFYRDDGTRLVKHLARQIEKAGGIKEVEKQKIIISLKRRLEELEEKDKKDLAAHLLEQASSGKDETKEVVFNEVMKYQGRGQELSGKEADEIAESIYSQLKEREEAHKILDRLGEKKKKEEEKTEREKEKKIREIEKKVPRSERHSVRETGAFGVADPGKTGRIDTASEVDKIKKELSKGLDEKEEYDSEGEDDFSDIKKQLEIKGEKEEEEGDSAFDELEKMSGGKEEGHLGETEEDSDEDFSMEGFKTEFGDEKKKKKEAK